ncbi:PREDICTED: L-lactate dehydrogenase-like [Polistes dominula]|uniref:L-lactate dehydrogenase-like n=1 Tax=Polistes dominula TaxID=743375 RepID=A0ABM1IRF7_POLDO|nr:PREDICTED: L-lactate dehydrogenase-like [Polistes dominula]
MENNNKKENNLINNKTNSKAQDDIEYDDIDQIPITTTSTKNALITTMLGPCEVYPHRVKVSIVGVGKIGMACAIAILMRRIASEVCLFDKDENRAMAEAEDIRHAGIFLGNPLVTGTSDVSMLQKSAVVIITTPEKRSNEEPNVKDNLEIFKKIIPPITKFVCSGVLLIVTEPVDVMSYIAFKLSKFPPNRVLGIGTLLDSARFQDIMSQKIGIARSSINCMSIGAQGNTSVPVWSSINVAGLKLRDINSRMGDKDDPEKWYEVTESVHQSDAVLNQMKGDKGPNCWATGICTAEIVDAIIRNTKVVLPVSTHICSSNQGIDNDVYMSIPCVIGREGVHCTVRQKLTDQEKLEVQACADSIRNTLRESGILQEVSEDVEK